MANEMLIISNISAPHIVPNGKRIIMPSNYMSYVFKLKVCMFPRGRERGGKKKKKTAQHRYQNILQRPVYRWFCFFAKKAKL